MTKKIKGQFRKENSLVIFYDSSYGGSALIRDDQNILNLNDLDTVEFNLYQGYAINLRFIERKRTPEADFDKLLKIADKMAKDLISQSKSVSGSIESLEDFYGFKRGLKKVTT